VAATEKHNKSKRTKPIEKFDFFHDERVRATFYQILTALVIGWFFW
jgi:general L-amino acid transport system permease protein